jgi:hypothetical protein
MREDRDHRGALAHIAHDSAPAGAAPAEETPEI